MNIPILGICYGIQIICQTLGGKVQSSSRREFGKAEIKILKKNLLLNKMEFSKNNTSQVWMSHGDEVVVLPKGFDKLAITKDNNIASIGNIKKNIYGLQFHPEVIHTISGKKIIENFLMKICKIKSNWKIENFLNSKIIEIKNKVGKEKSNMRIIRRC